jgi:transposase
MPTNIDEFIRSSPTSSELIRAMAVKQDLQGTPRKIIASVLGKSLSFICKWRSIYEEHGIAGFYSVHQGGSPRAFLSEGQRAEVTAYIASQPSLSTEALIHYIQEHYQVQYQSRQSYYQLLHTAKMSWHKSQKTNPRRQPEQVAERREELKKSPGRRRKD